MYSSGRFACRRTEGRGAARMGRSGDPCHMYYARTLQVRATTPLAVTRPTGFSDAGFYDVPDSPPMMTRAPTPLMSPPRRVRQQRQPRGSQDALPATIDPPNVNGDGSVPGPGAYSPLWQRFGVTSEMSRPHSAAGGARGAPKLEWERGPDGLLRPPQSRSQLSPDPRLLYVGNQGKLLERSQLLSRASEFGDSIRSLPSSVDSGIFDGVSSRAPERIAPQAQISEWWHLPRGERRPRGPSIVNNPFGPRPFTANGEIISRGSRGF